MDIDIRLATVADTADAARLFKAQLLEHHLPAEDAQIARGLARTFAAGSPAWIAIARRGVEAVGITLTNRNVSVEKGGEFLWMEELYVVPAERRHGVASALLRFLETTGQAAGIAGIELEVVPTQTGALALYARHGFKQVDRLRVSKTFG
jgi:ribosomal protein S18 acetylase RimI-like enzyme